MYKIIIVILFSYLTSIAQNTNNDTTRLNNFWKSVDRISQINAENELNKTTIDSNETRTIMLEYYKLNSENPIGYKKSITQKFKAWEIKNKGRNKSERELKPGVKNGRLKRFLAKSYGTEFVEIIGVPYFLKGKIESIEKGNYYSEPDNQNYSKTVLKIRVKDVLKGKNIFSSEQIIEISVLNFWYESSPDFFTVNGEYFFPIKPWNCNNLGCSEYSISFLPNTNFTIFPIYNGVISDVEFFKIGSGLSWDNFRSKFIEKYVIKEEN